MLRSNVPVVNVTLLDVVNAAARTHPPIVLLKVNGCVIVLPAELIVLPVILE